jgi:hypothetical protein
MAVNYAAAFTNQTSFTVTGATHGLGTKALLIAVYDASAPAVQIQAGRITVHPSTFDVTLTFRQAQSGSVVLCGGLAGTTPLGHFAQGFTAQTSVTITGTTHRLGTKNLIVAVYDAGSPRQRITPGRVTVDASSFDVVVTFRQAQSGTIVLCGGADTGTAPYSADITNQTSLTIGAGTHNLATAAILAQCYDTATPANVLELGSLTVDASTFQVVAAFRQAVNGTLILNGSQQVFNGAASLTQAAMTAASASVITLSGTATPTTASLTTSSAGTIPLNGAASLTQAAASLSSAGAVALTGAATVTQATHTVVSTSNPDVFGAATLTQAAGSLTSAAVIAVGGVVSRTQANQILTSASALAITGTLARTQANDVFASSAFLPVLGVSTMTQAAASVSAAELSETPNYGQSFTNQTSLTIPGATHGLGTKNLIIALYDTQSPRRSLEAGSITVHPTTCDVTILFRQSQSGRVVINAASTGFSNKGSLALPFTAQTSVSVAGTTHGYGTADLLVTAYDAASPAQQITPAHVLIDPASFNITAVFAQAVSGTLLVTGYAARAGVANVGVGFTSQLTVTVTGGTHGLGTKNLLVAVYDNATPARRVQAGSITVDPNTFDVQVAFRQPQSGTIVLNGSQQVTNVAILTQAAQSMTSAATLALQADSAMTQAGVTLSTTGAHETANSATGFSNQTSITILGTAHQAATKNLLVQVYDASTPAVRFVPDLITVHPSTFDVTVTFVQPQSGRIILNGCLPSQTSHGNAAQGFTGQMSVTMLGTTHQLNTSNLLVALYDTQNPAREITPDLITVHPTTFDVTATFVQPQSGFLVVAGYAITAPVPNVGIAFISQTSVGITFAMHGLSTKNLVVQVYDASTPARMIRPQSITVDPTSFDVTVSFAQPQTGTIVLNGSSQGMALAFLQQTAFSMTSAAVLAVQAASTPTLAAMTSSSTGAIPLLGVSSLTKATQTLSSTAVTPILAALTQALGAMSFASTGVLDLRGQAILLQQGAALSSAATGSVPAGTAVLLPEAQTLSSASLLALAGTVSLTQANMPAASTAVLAVQALSTLTGQSATVQADGVNLAGGSAFLATAAMSSSSAAILATNGTAILTAAGMACAAASTLTLSGTLTRTQANVVLAATGVNLAGGSAFLSQAACTLASNAVTLAGGNAILIAGTATCSSAGTIPLNGAATLTQGNASCTSAAVLPLQATLSLNAQPHTLAGLAGLAGQGTAVLTQGTTTVSSDGTSPRNGQAALILPAVLGQGDGSSPRNGQAALTTGNALCVASTAVVAQGAAMLVQVDVSLQGAGSVGTQSGVTQTTAPMVTMAAGTVPILGNGAPTTASMGASSQSVLPLQASSALTQAAVSGSAQGFHDVFGAVSLTQAACSMVASTGLQAIGTMQAQQDAMTCSSSADAETHSDTTRALQPMVMSATAQIRWYRAIGGKVVFTGSRRRVPFVNPHAAHQGTVTATEQDAVTASAGTLA